MPSERVEQVTLAVIEAQENIRLIREWSAEANVGKRRTTMHAAIAEKRESLTDLCSRYGVARLDVFGSAARGVDFDPARSDVDFLVEFRPQIDDLASFLDFKAALEALLSRPVDLVDRRVIETSRNYIRKRAILAGAEPIYGA